jgi:hypothetical protein
LLELEGGDQLNMVMLKDYHHHHKLTVSVAELGKESGVVYASLLKSEEGLFNASLSFSSFVIKGCPFRPSWNREKGRGEKGGGEGGSLRSLAENVSYLRNSRHTATAVPGKTSIVSTAIVRIAAL